MERRVLRGATRDFRFLLHVNHRTASFFSSAEGKIRQRTHGEHEAIRPASLAAVGLPEPLGCVEGCVRCICVHLSVCLLRCSRVSRWRKRLSGCTGRGLDVRCGGSLALFPKAQDVQGPLHQEHAVCATHLIFYFALFIFVCDVCKPVSLHLSIHPLSQSKR